MTGATYRIHTPEEFDDRNRMLGWLFVAAFLSLATHVLLFLWFKGLDLTFSKPVVDPYEPTRVHVTRANIDPSRIEKEPPAPAPSPAQQQPRPPSVEPEDLLPGEIAAFSGPLKAPRIPLPKIAQPDSQSLSAGAAKVPIDAFSALEISPEGKLPKFSDALVKEATTAALDKSHDILTSTNLAGGPDSTSSGKGIPSFSDISDLVGEGPKISVARPAFQPILLRLSSDLLFEFDSAELRPEGCQKLTQLGQALQNARKLNITIEGHTDTIGEAPYNKDLSLRRARAVADWLTVNGGISGGSFTVRGYGEERPIVNPNGNQDEQRLNRRVELRIVGEK